MDWPPAPTTHWAAGSTADPGPTPAPILLWTPGYPPGRMPNPFVVPPGPGPPSVTLIPEPDPELWPPDLWWTNVDPPAVRPRARAPPIGEFVGCYLLTPAQPTTYRWRASYVGCTKVLEKRLRQHNGVLAGGARATESEARRPWEFVAVVHGFRDKSEALLFETDWIDPTKQPARLHGAGVGTPGSVKRKFAELFEMLNAPPWRSYRLHVSFSTTTSRDVARSLGSRMRWPAQMGCSTQLVPDLIRGIGENVDEPAYTAKGPVVAAHVDGPSNSELALSLFARNDPSTCVCLLCMRIYCQEATRGYNNLIRHLKLKHSSCFLAEFEQRTLAAQ